MNKKIILILTEPRTGSYLLNEAFNFYSLNPVGEFFLTPEGYQSPNKLACEVHLNNEQLTELFNFLKVEQGNRLELIKQINLNPINSVRKLYEISSRSLVIKIHDFQFDRYQLDELLDLPYVEVIILQRSNRMARYVSHLKAEQTNIWHTVDTSDIQVVVDREDFIKTEQESSNWFKKIKQRVSSKDYLEINYERDLENFNKEQFYKLFDSWFEKINLDVTKTNYRIKLFKKQNKSKLQYNITNYKEIKDLIQ
jgi:LPS sulfotransferase NodH